MIESIDLINEHLFFYIYLFSGFLITWYRPIKATLSSNPSDYHIFIRYWVILSLVLFIENVFFPVYSTNLGYYFMRTLAFYSLVEGKSFFSSFSNLPVPESAKTLSKIGNLKDIKALCSLISTDEDIEVPENLHPWAPTPTSIGILAICRIGELASLNSLTLEDEEYIIQNYLNTIVEYLNDTEDAKSQNSLLCIHFLSEKKNFREILAKMGIFEKLKRFVDNKNKQVAEAALRTCRNVYNFNYELQNEFIKTGMCKRLVNVLKESDPFSVIEGFDNIFSLICTPKGDIVKDYAKVLLNEGLVVALAHAENNHGNRKELKDQLSMMREVVKRL